MKFSQFNTFLPFEDKMLCYNAFTDKYLLVEYMLYDIIEVARLKKNPEEIQEVHPAFYDALCSNGMLVDASTDEIDNVRNLIHEVDHNDQYYRLIINPTMNCNFKCWYCYETHIKESRMDEQMVEKTMKLIKNTLNTYKNLKQYQISFFGGEPLLYYQKVIRPILNYAHEAAREAGVKLIVEFTTNGYLITPEMVEEFKQFSIGGLQITLDGARDQHNTVRFVNKTKGSYDEIVNNIVLLAENGFNVTARINYTEKNLESVFDILDDLSQASPPARAKILISMHQVWQDEARGLGNKVSDFMKASREKGFATAHSILGDTVRYSCYADKMLQATVNYNGDVFKCTARDFTTENRDGHLDDEGNIVWSERLNVRMNSKLKNKPCLECAILPICGGGCSQKAMEYNGEDYCVNFFDENRKKSIVKDRFIAIAIDTLKMAEA